MPFYTYRCTKCSHETTERRPVGGRDAPGLCYNLVPIDDRPLDGVKVCRGETQRKLEAGQVVVPRGHRAAG